MPLFFLVQPNSFSAFIHFEGWPTARTEKQQPFGHHLPSLSPFLTDCELHVPSLPR
ncbi:hypothetical protein SLEP1_g19054 [Rubroshorea leprosula]|nr:hypothetical protein SLEP1_g19054 [Rubroshorea leprosula]